MHIHEKYLGVVTWQSCATFKNIVKPHTYLVSTKRDNHIFISKYQNIRDPWLMYLRGFLWRIKFVRVSEAKTVWYWNIGLPYMRLLTSCELWLFKHFESHCPAGKTWTFSAFILLLRGKDSFWLDRDNNFGSVAIAESWILRLGNILHYFWHFQHCFGSLKLTLDKWCHFWWALILLFAKKKS